VTPGVAPVLVASRLAEAVGAYRAAIVATLADDLDEAASSSKNLGVAIARFISARTFEDHGGILAFVKLAAEGFHAFVVAADKGQRAGKSREWLDGVEDSALLHVQNARELLSKAAADIHVATRHIEMLADALCDLASPGRSWLSGALADAFARGNVAFAAPLAMSAQIVAADMLVKTVVVLVEEAGARKKRASKEQPKDGLKMDDIDNDDDDDDDDDDDEAEQLSADDVRARELVALRKGLPLLTSCEPHLERARAFLGPPEGPHNVHPRCSPGAAELAELVESVALHRAILESRQARMRGDQLLAAATRGSGELSVEGVWAAADAYKEAVLLAREIDIEGEAMAYSALGKVFTRVLMLKEKGLQAYVRCIELAMSCTPRPFTAHEWYRDAMTAVEEAQKRAREAEEAAEAAEEAELLKDQQGVLDAINAAAAQSGLALLRHVYAQHPPKKAGAVLGPVDAPSFKSTLKLAIVHYHPDKQGKEHGAKWAALANYICKRLTVAYEVVNEQNHSRLPT